MVITHNLTAGNAMRYNLMNTNNLSKSLEKLSSGFKINRAGDNAAGLAVSEKMRAQLRGIRQAVNNAHDGISMIQTFEGALTETHNILNRIKTLAAQSANGTYDDQVDRAAIELEYEQLCAELDDIAETDFNGKTVLNSIDPSADPKRLPSTYEVKLVEEGTVELAGIAEALEAKGYFAAGQAPTFTYEPPATNPELPTNKPLSLSYSVDTNSNEITINMENTGDSINIDLSAFTTPGATTIMNLGHYGSIVAESNGAMIAPKYDVTVGATALSSGSLAKISGAATLYTGSTGMFNVTYTDNSTPHVINDASKAYAAGDISQLTAEVSASGILTVKAGSSSDPFQFTGIADISELDAVNETVTLNLGGIGTIEIELLFKNPGGYTTGTASGVQTQSGNPFSTFNATSVSARDSIAKSTVSNFSPINTEKLGDIIVATGTVAVADVALQVGARTKDLKNYDFHYAHVWANTGDSAGTKAKAIGELTGDINTTAAGLGMVTDTLNLSTQTNANAAIDQVDHAINKVSMIRATFGAIQNRLEHKVDNLNNTDENLTAAESRIRDTDMAREVVKNSKLQILAQASQAMLAQANQLPQSVMQFLQ